MTDTLAGTLQEIVDDYPSDAEIGQDNRYTTTNDLPPKLDELFSELTSSTIPAVIDSAGDFKIDYSTGAGNLTKTPHLSIKRTDETRSTKRGIYIVYLFDIRNEELYLTLNQGSDEITKARKSSAVTTRMVDILRNHANQYETYFAETEGFEPKPAGLPEDFPKGEGYNAGAVLTRKYTLDDLEEDELVHEELRQLTRAYDEFLDALYSEPQYQIDNSQVWTISPEGGDYWSEWRDHDIASIGYRVSDHSPFDDTPPGANTQDRQRQVYRFVEHIKEGDLVVAGARVDKTDRVFGVGRVTKDYADSETDPDWLPDSFPHVDVIDVEWYEIDPDGLAINCIKNNKQLFHQHTLHEFPAQFGAFAGAVKRRLLATELHDGSWDGKFPELENTLDLVRVSSERPDTISLAHDLQVTEGDSGEEKPTKETYSEYYTEDDVFGSSAALEIPDSLVFPNSDRLLQQIESALQNDKHIIFTGPPGTGKTKLARHVAGHYMKDSFEMVTATADWSTFDTIGGYRPASDSTLDFHEGVFLDRFADTEGNPKNEWLIIDELNRADIDKAFGSLFSALTGETVTLPFEKDDESVVLVGDPRESDVTHLAENHYFIPPSWRLIGTMNTYDKTSLYQMSYAFMRRFAFIPVRIPGEIGVALIEDYLSSWFDTPVDTSGNYATAESKEGVSDLWEAINDVRSVGPAIVRDIMTDVRSQEDPDFTNPVIMYVLPQMEGLTSQKQQNFVSAVVDLNTEERTYVEPSELKSFAEDYFDINIQLDDEQDE